MPHWTDIDPDKHCCESCERFEDWRGYEYDEGCGCTEHENYPNLKSFPFKKGCKDWKAKWWTDVDWDAEHKKDIEREQSRSGESNDS